MKYILTGLIAAGFIFCAAFAHATPPSGIHAKYDNARGELDILVQHPVTKPKTHHISKVVISKNGREAKTLEFNFQTSHRNQTMIPIKIPAAAGDEFKITATCNEWGSMEKNLKVE